MWLFCRSPGRGAAFGVVIVATTDWAFDIGQAAAYMQLAGWSLGVSSCLSWLGETEIARSLLGIPAEWHLHIAISFGYAAEPPAPPQRVGRHRLDEVVHWKEW